MQRRCHRLGTDRLHPAQRHAEVLGLQDDADAFRRQPDLQPVADVVLVGSAELELLTPPSEPLTENQQAALETALAQRLPTLRLDIPAGAAVRFEPITYQVKEGDNPALIGTYFGLQPSTIVWSKRA